MNAPECPRADEIGWFSRHRLRPCKFVARYSGGAPTPEAIKAMHPSLGVSVGGLDQDDVAAVKALAPRTYIYDICVKCGVTVEPAK